MVSQEHSALLHESSPSGVISLLQVIHRAKRSSSPLQCIGMITSQLTSNEPVVVLNALYGTLDIAQSSSNAVDVGTILPILLSTLTSYAKPIDTWLRTGIIKAEEPFFVAKNEQKSQNLSSLWHDWYTVSLAHDKLLPAFLKQYVTRIFTIGKVAAFLSRLGSTIEAIL